MKTFLLALSLFIFSAGPVCGHSHPAPEMASFLLTVSSFYQRIWQPPPGVTELKATNGSTAIIFEVAGTSDTYKHLACDFFTELVSRSLWDDEAKAVLEGGIYLEFIFLEEKSAIPYIGIFHNSSREPLWKTAPSDARRQGIEVEAVDAFVRALKNLRAKKIQI